MPTVTLQPRTIRSLSAVTPLHDAIKSLGDDWNVELEGPLASEEEYRSGTGIEVGPAEVYLIVAWEAIARPAAEQLLDAVKRAAHDAWQRQRGRTVEYVVINQGRREIQRVRVPH